MTEYRKIEVRDCPGFDPEFPENFKDWHLIDSIKLDRIVTEIKGQIKEGFTNQDLNYVPGLRMALIIIAGEAEIYNYLEAE